MSGIIAQNVGRHTGLVKAAEGGGGAWTLISTATASSDATISFTSGLDSTYDEYCFKFLNAHPSEGAYFRFNASTDSGSSYAATKTCTFFSTQHKEDGSSTAFQYDGGNDLAQSTAAQVISYSIQADADSGSSGFLYLWAPASTVFVKHFIARSNTMGGGPHSNDVYVGGYLNTASAIDAVQFSMSAGDIDSGTISLYGIG
jgi:hypothetical protein